MSRLWNAARRGVYKSGRTKVQTESEKRHSLTAAAEVLNRPVAYIAAEDRLRPERPKFTKAERRAWKRRDREVTA